MAVILEFFSFIFFSSVRALNFDFSKLIKLVLLIDTAVAVAQHTIQTGDGKPVVHPL